CRAAADGALGLLPRVRLYRVLRGGVLLQHARAGRAGLCGALAQLVFSGVHVPAAALYMAAFGVYTAACRGVFTAALGAAAGAAADLGKRPRRRARDAARRVRICRKEV